MHRCLPFLALALSACAPTVIPLYEEARTEALADPGPLPDVWHPDAVVHLSEAMLTDTLDVLLESEGTLSETLDVALLKATPNLKVTQLVLGEADCDQCLGVDATLKGDVLVDSPLGKHKAKISAKLSFDAEFAVVAGDTRWVLTVVPRRVRKVKLTVGGTGLKAVTTPISTWLQSHLLADIEPIPMAELGSADLPLRAMRVVPSGNAIQVHLLTATPTPTAIPMQTVVLKTGWQLELASDSLVDLARIATFNAGPVARDIVPEPTSFHFDEDQFVLGLRLWGTSGRGWWRDYEVRGDIDFEGRNITLVPGKVTETDHSRGAGWADPRIMLGKGVVLKAIEGALQTSLPAVHRDKGDALRVVVKIKSLTGNDNAVVADGSFLLKEQKKVTPQSGKAVGGGTRRP